MSTFQPLVDASMRLLQRRIRPRIRVGSFLLLVFVFGSALAWWTSSRRREAGLKEHSFLARAHRKSVAVSRSKLDHEILGTQSWLERELGDGSRALPPGFDERLDEAMRVISESARDLDIFDAKAIEEEAAMDAMAR